VVPKTLRIAAISIANTINTVPDVIMAVAENTQVSSISSSNALCYEYRVTTKTALFTN
jgi:hypothetical protein